MFLIPPRPAPRLCVRFVLLGFVVVVVVFCCGEVAECQRSVEDQRSLAELIQKFSSLSLLERDVQGQKEQTR